MGEQSQLLEAIRGIFDEKMLPLIKEVKDRIAKNEVRTEAAHTRLDDHDARLERLESAGGSGSGEFIPKSIEFKGFCEWKVRRSEGVSRVEAETLITRLTESLPGSLKAKLGQVHLRGPKCHKFSLDVAPGFAEEISAIFKDALKDPAYFRQGKTLNTTVERKPEIQKLYAAGGKARAFLRSKVSGVGGSAECSWEPEWRLTITNGQSEAVIGVVSPTSAIAWDDAVCQQHLRLTAAQIQQELLSFKD